MTAVNDDLRVRVLQRFEPDGAFDYPPAVILNDLLVLGDEQDVRRLVAQLLRERVIRYAVSVPGVWWRPRWIPLQDLPLHATNGQLAGAVARQLGADPIVAVREAEGVFGLDERYDKPGSPGLVASPNVETVRRLGVKGGRTFVIVEPVPEWIADLYDGVAQVVAQAFRNHIHLPPPAIDELARNAAKRVVPGALLQALSSSTLSMPAPYDRIIEVMRVVAEKAIEECRILPGDRAPEGWAAPEQWSGPMVSGDWRVEEFEENGILYHRLTGGTLTGHPYLAYPTNRWTSSPLVWIDRRRGWARTNSRLYRLVGRGADNCAE